MNEDSHGNANLAYRDPCIPGGYLGLKDAKYVPW